MVIGMGKATAIRKIARESCPSQTNKWYANEIRRRFGIEVCPSHIIEILGPHKKRKELGNALENQLKLAAEFAQSVGNKENAVRLLNLLDSDK